MEWCHYSQLPTAIHVLTKSQAKQTTTTTTNSTCNWKLICTNGLSDWSHEYRNCTVLTENRIERTLNLNKTNLNLKYKKKGPRQCKNSWAWELQPRSNYCSITFQLWGLPGEVRRKCPPRKCWGEDKLYENSCKMPGTNTMNSTWCYSYINTNIILRKCILQFSSKLPDREIRNYYLNGEGKKQTNKKTLRNKTSKFLKCVSGNFAPPPQ